MADVYVFAGRDVPMVQRKHSDVLLSPPIHPTRKKARRPAATIPRRVLGYTFRPT